MNTLSTQALTLGSSTISGNGSTLFVNGNDIIGNLSGNLTGIYYPLSNPSGYITGLNTGSFVTTNQTGIFVNISMTGIFINTSMTGNLVNTSMTGNLLDKNTIQTIIGNKFFSGNLIISGATENVYFSQKSNNEFVWGLNVNSLNSDKLDNTGDSAFKFGVMTTNQGNGGGGYNGLHLQTVNSGVGTWSSASTVWTIDVFGNMAVTGSSYHNAPIYMSGSQLSSLYQSFAGPSLCPYSKVSGAFSITNNISNFLVNTSSGTATGTFPNASTTSGLEFTVKDWQGNAYNNPILLTGVSGQNFDGSTNFLMNTNYQSNTFISDGQNWCII